MMLEKLFKDVTEVRHVGFPDLDQLIYEYINNFIVLFLQRNLNRRLLILVNGKRQPIIVHKLLNLLAVPYIGEIVQVGEPQRINHLCDELAVVVGLVALVEALSKLVELVEKGLGVVVGDL